MWRTPLGNRILSGAEADLFRDGIGSLFDRVREGDGWETGLEIFDRLTTDQKIVHMAHIAKALLYENFSVPKHTATLEGTVAAIYDHLMEMVLLEVEHPQPGEDNHAVRKLILTAAQEAEMEDLPGLHETDLEEWTHLIGSLVDRILWDADYEQADLFLDIPPEAAQRIMPEVGIGTDYYTTQPPEPTEDQVQAARRVILRLDPVGRGMV